MGLQNLVFFTCGATELQPIGFEDGLDLLMTVVDGVSEGGSADIPCAGVNAGISRPQSWTQNIASGEEGASNVLRFDGFVAESCVLFCIVSKMIRWWHVVNVVVRISLLDRSFMLQLSLGLQGRSILGRCFVSHCFCCVFSESTVVSGFFEIVSPLPCTVLATPATAR